VKRNINSKRNAASSAVHKVRDVGYELNDLGIEGSFPTQVPCLLSNDYGDSLPTTKVSTGPVTSVRRG